MSIEFLIHPEHVHLAHLSASLIQCGNPDCGEIHGVALHIGFLVFTISFIIHFKP